MFIFTSICQDRILFKALIYNLLFVFKKRNYYLYQNFSREKPEEKPNIEGSKISHCLHTIEAKFINSRKKALKCFLLISVFLSFPQEN